MKMRPLSATGAPHPPEFPDAACLAALHAWYAGLTTRAAVTRYLPDHKTAGQSARGILGRTRRQLIAFARSRQRADLAASFEHPLAERLEQAKAVTYAIEVLRAAPAPEPRISDDIGLWLSARAVAALRAHGIDTLSELTVRIPRRRRWWSAIPGLGSEKFG